MSGLSSIIAPLGIPQGGAIATHQGRTAVYRLYDQHDALIYVGITNNPPQRWRLHAYEKPWWSDVTLREIEWFATRAEAEAVESDLIAYRRPKWNKDGGERSRGKPGSPSGRLRAGWTPDDATTELVALYEAKQNELAAVRDRLEARLVEIMRQGVSATRISKFLPFSTVMIQAIGKRAGVPLLRKPTVRSLRDESEPSA
ncbi:GIY-YIG nuclease family protein [Streptomyces sp. NPDC038707]|uniref:GIY-YIG nuclease family protein n=1 Tax=Streptomyces sp. NPDC038707 TaxID=3154329 RepID=UPI0033D632EF